MKLDKLVVKSILGESDEEALEIVRTMRLARISGANIKTQQSRVSKTKSKTSVPKGSKEAVQKLSKTEVLEMLKLLEGA